MPVCVAKNTFDAVSATLLSLLVLTFCLRPSIQQTACPPGWNLLSGSCILVNSTFRISWCDANRECAKLGAELLTNSDVISNLRNTNPNQALWVGVSDLANERQKQRDGWQFVNGRGVLVALLADPDGPWHPADPNTPGQDCLMFNVDNSKQGLMDKFCDDSSAGFVCELKPQNLTPTCTSADIGPGSRTGRTRWIPQPPRPAGSETNIESRYCWTEHVDVAALRECAMLAGARPLSRSFFFNSAQRRCRVLEFSDSQTSLDVGPSTGWAKFLRV